MRILTTSLLAGIASVALVGTVAAQTPSSHILTVQLPDGGVEQIYYAGDAPPRVAFVPPAMALDEADFSGFGPGSPFAALERISAEMNLEAAAMFRQAIAVTAEPSGPEHSMQIDATSLPAGAQSYTYVATTNGNTVCRRSVEITSRGPDAKPQIVSHISGDCGASENVTPTMLPNAAPLAPAGHVLSAKAQPHAHPGLMREAAWRPLD